MSRSAVRIAWLIALRTCRRDLSWSVPAALSVALPVALLAAASVTLRSLMTAQDQVVSAELAAILVLACLLTMVVAGMITCSAMIVGVRRRWWELGALVAAGADSAMRGLVVVAVGSVIGCAGTLAGTLAGVLGGTALLALSTTATGWTVPTPIVAGADLLMAAALGVFAAVIASLPSARWSARLTVSEVRSARPRPADQEVKRLAFTGISLGTAGLLVSVAGAFFTGIAVAAVLTGSLLSIAGFALCAPAIVSSVAKRAAVLPLNARLAFRALGRRPLESGFGLAAITVILASAVLASTLLASAEKWEMSRYVPFYGRDQVVVTPSDRATGRAVASRIAELVEGSSVTELVEAADERGSALRSVSDDQLVDRGSSTSVAVGGRDVVEALGGTWPGVAIERARDQSVLAFGGSDHSNRMIVLESVSPTGAVTPMPATVVDAGIPVRGGLPSLVVSKQAARRLGLGTSRGWIVKAPRALQHTEIASARRIAASVEGQVIASVETGTDATFRTLRWAIGVVGAVIALSLLVLTVTQATADSRELANTIWAVGMERRRLRELAAARAFGLTALAAAMALPVGLLTGAAIIAARSNVMVLPWEVLSGVTVGLPVIAGLAAAAFPPLIDARS